MNYYIYFIKEIKAHRKDKPCVKIGVSKNVNMRLKNMQTGNPRQLMVALTLGPYSEIQAFSFERKIHKIFKDCHVRGEWFRNRVLKNLTRLAEYKIKKKWQEAHEITDPEEILDLELVHKMRGVI